MKKNKIRNLLVVFFILTTAITISGCNNEPEASLEEIITSMEVNIDSESMKQGDNKALKRFYGLNSNDFQEVILYVPKTSMDVNELLIIKVKDSSQVEGIEIAIEERVDRQLENFNGYGVEQCALLEEYEIKVVGNYFFYTVAKDSEDLKVKFTKEMK